VHIVIVSNGIFISLLTAVAGIKKDKRLMLLHAKCSGNSLIPSRLLFGLANGNSDETQRASNVGVHSVGHIACG
jgi:hypothetical protein